jgi:aminopeptidase YwaD
MKHSFLLILLLWLSSITTAFSQDMERVRQTIDTLASPYFHGRGYVKDGDTKAAAFLKDRFKEIGLEPFGKSYYQCFNFSVNTITQTPQLIVDGRALIAGKDFVARASSASGKGTLEVLILDTLIFNNPTLASRFFSQNLSNKAVVYKQQHEQQFQLLDERHRSQLMQAGLLIVLQPKTLLTSVARNQAQAAMLEVLESSWPASAHTAQFKVKALLKPAHKANNVIAFVKGRIHPDSFLVFTAHYDHLGGQGKDLYFPGANDNASGTAMLLELAEHYSKPENQPEHSIAFIAFAAEEAGLLGSKFYVDNPLFPLQQIKFLVNLDLLGTGDDGLMVVNGKVHEREFALLSHINSQRKLLPQIKSRGKAANSDHYPFSERGVPAFFLYTLGGTTAYHNPQDHAEQLPLTKFREVFQLITAFIEAL